MQFSRLTPEQREFFDANGYLIIPDALDQDTIDQVATAADRLMDDFAYEGFYQHRRDGLVQDPTLAKLATSSAIIPLVIQLLGTHIHITNTALIYKHPQPADDPGDCTWHRDVGVHLGLGPRPSPARRPQGRLLPHRHGRTLYRCHALRARQQSPRRTPRHTQRPRFTPQSTSNPASKPATPFSLKAASTTARRSTAKTTSPRSRCFGYHYSWIRPDYYLRYYADEVQPSAAVVANLDDVGRQLLGGYRRRPRARRPQRHPLVHCRMGRRARPVFGKGTAAEIDAV